MMWHCKRSACVYYIGHEHFDSKQQFVERHFHHLVTAVVCLTIESIFCAMTLAMTTMNWLIRLVGAHFLTTEWIVPALTGLRLLRLIRPGLTALKMLRAI